MSQYKFSINGKSYEVSVNSIEGSSASVNVNGVDYNVAIESGLSGAQSPEGASHPFGPTAGAVPPLTQPRVACPSGNSAPESQSGTPSEAAPAAVKSGSGKKIVSPLPGVIIDVCVKEGDSVKRGAKIAVIEAMKMENDILAEADGTVSAIFIKKGDSVLEGADIASIA